jgi:hypothetical protein
MSAKMVHHTRKQKSVRSPGWNQALGYDGDKILIIQAFNLDKGIVG